MCLCSLGSPPRVYYFASRSLYLILCLSLSLHLSLSIPLCINLSFPLSCFPFTANPFLIEKKRNMSLHCSPFYASNLFSGSSVALFYYTFSYDYICKQMIRPKCSQLQSGRNTQVVDTSPSLFSFEALQI